MTAHLPLTGRTAVVTGGSSGLGRATAVPLATAGADVAVLARGSSELDDTAAQVGSGGRRAAAVVVDLADAAAVERAAAQVLDELGGINVLVNAAGTECRVPSPSSTWRAGTASSTSTCAHRSYSLGRWPHMVAAGGGTIINISSVAGRRGWAYASAYCAAKFGLTGFTQALAAEGKPHGIRACVVPGAMDNDWGVWSPQDRGSTAPTGPEDAPRPGACRGPACVDRVRATRRRAQRGHRDTAAGAGLALTPCPARTTPTRTDPAG